MGGTASAGAAVAWGEEGASVMVGFQAGEYAAGAVPTAWRLGPGGRRRSIVLKRKISGLTRRARARTRTLALAIVHLPNRTTIALPEMNKYRIYANYLKKFDIYSTITLL